MTLKDTADRFGALSMLLHWATALAVVATVPLALIMQDMPLSLDKLQAYGWHKSIGMAVLAVTVLRLTWRSVNRRPAPPAGPAWQRRAARGVHAALYVCLLALPVLGWLHSAAANTPVVVLGLLVLPPPIAADRALVEPLRAAHAAVAWTLLALLALHVLAALKHAVVDRDATLRRMLPLALGAVLLAPAPALAEPPAWRLDPAASTITVVATQMGGTFEGVFRQFEAEIRFDPADLGASRVVVTIATGSLDTGNDQRDEAARAPAWFDAAAHPAARFEATRFRSLGGDRYAADGTLAIKGLARPVTLPFTLAIAGGRAVAAGALTVERADYALGTGEWAANGVVGATVEIGIDIRAARD